MTIISALIAPYLIRKIRTQWIVVLSIMLTVIGLIGFSFSTQYWMLFLFVVLYGLGAGSVDSALNNYVAKHCSSSVMNFLHCFYGVGAMISPYIMSLALSHAHWNEGYRWTAYMLHDQRIVVGMGNIYSDEILYASHIYPEKPCNTLSDGEWQRLAVQIPAIIAWAIKANEISPEEYLVGKGKEYRNTPHFKAYSHKGKPCPVCGKLFVRIVVGGRSSCYCPECQKK